MKLASLIISLNLVFSVWLHIEAQPVFAQPDQQASQDIVAGDISIRTPDFFSFGQTFFSNQTQTIQKVLDPNLSENLISITDLRNLGGFTVDVRISDLTSGTDHIDYDNIGILTTSKSPSPTTIDITPNSLPVDISAPLDYDWDFSSIISPAEFTIFSFDNNETSLPIIIIDGSTPGGTGRVGKFELSFGVSLEIPALQEPGTYLGDLTITLNA